VKPTDSRPTQPVGSLADDHELSARARRYGERVVSGTDWPIENVDCTKITWGTSKRAKRRHGRCSYDGDGEVTITLTEHTYERAGFEACQTTIRHELVHAWQYQHRGRQAISTESGLHVLTDSDASPTTQRYSDHTASLEAPQTHSQDEAKFTIETGHGKSFRAWIGPLELPGRCSRYYERRPSDFAYVYACPDCTNWWGKHRLCKSVRQAAHGGEGSSGYRYCTNCEVLLHLRVGEWYLAHGDHDDVTIKTFAQPDAASVVDTDLPLIHLEDSTPISRSAVE